MSSQGCFPLTRVRLLEGPLRDRQIVNGRHLRSLDADRLLAVFRRESGLPAKAETYGGWEARGIGGHGLGHYLSAVALHYGATGETWAAERVRMVVDELAACQTACGDGGVMSSVKPALLDLREGKIDANHAKLNGHWVPFYVMHKLFAGLRDAYRLVGCDRALEVGRKLAGWLETVLQDKSPEQIQTMLRTEHGGMNEVLADLAADTGDERYLRMAKDWFYHEAVLGPMMRGEDRLDGLHGNTQIPKVLGLAREYELGGSAGYRPAAESFWSHVVERRSYATGGHGENEHFFPPEDFPKHLTPYTCETCNSYNMLKLTSHLFAWSPEEGGAARMDFVERTLINHIAANIGRREGEFGYFLALGSVAVKAYSTPHDSWWCCVGTGLENPARYGEMVYYEQAQTLWLNLYVGSELTSSDGSFGLRQETRFPAEDTVRISINCATPVRRSLRLRHPAWCERLEITLNGALRTDESPPSTYHEIDREWHDGDTLEVRLPMQLRLEPLPHSDRRQLAVMFGPMLLAAVVPPVSDRPDPAKERHGDHLFIRGKTDEFPPFFVAENEEQVLAGLVPTEQFGRFRSRCIVMPADLAFVPLYTIYEEHYAVYLPRLSPQEWCEREAVIRKEQAREQELAAATLDQVQPGQQQPEIEHAFRDEKTESCHLHNRHGRAISAGGWCSFEMRCATDEPVALVATYWGSEWHFPEFDLLVEGTQIASERLRINQPGDFFDVAYVLPVELTRGQESVTVRMQTHAGSASAQIYGLRLMQAAAVVGDPHFVLPPSRG